MTKQTRLRQKIPKAQVRRSRLRAAPKSRSLDSIEKIFTRFLRRKVGVEWPSVYRSMVRFSRGLRQAEQTYLDGMLDTYIELTPLLWDGCYYRADGYRFGGVGMFYVDAGGILRETTAES